MHHSRNSKQNLKKQFNNHKAPPGTFGPGGALKAKKEMKKTNHTFRFDALESAVLREALSEIRGTTMQAKLTELLSDFIRMRYELQRVTGKMIRLTDKLYNAEELIRRRKALETELENYKPLL